MKKLFMLTVLLVVAGSLSADFMQPAREKIPLTIENQSETKLISRSSRDTPDWEFVVDPVALLTNYYDYMPGSYNSTPVRVQPDAFGGIYITFHAMETADATRRVYYAYIGADGSVTVAPIGTDNIKEGYAGIDIDPVTGDPFCAWHVDVDPGTVDLEVVCTYDTYHVLQSPGLWLTPFVVMDDTTPQPYGPSDEFAWPYVHIGPSPDPAKRRIYVQANNADDTPTGSPSENILLAYADFDQTDLDNGSTLDWSYNTIPLLNEWHIGVPEWIRPFQSFAVSKVDGKVAFYGYNTNDEIYVFLNDNYGEGDFTYIPEAYQFDTWNPQNQDGSYVFEDENGTPYTLYWAFTHSGHMTSIFSEGSNKLNFCGNLGLNCYEGFYFPYEIFPKAFQFDLDTETFSFHDLDITGLNPDDNIPMVPWDIDEDGVVDEFSPEGNVMMYNGWPIWFWSTDPAFHENNHKICSNESGSRMVNIWQDGLKSKYYNDAGDEDYIDWAEIAEIYIAVSNDGGATWSDPIIMNALVGDENYVTELDGMMPAYVYCGDKIEDLGGSLGEVHLFFLDDESYGSFIQGWGQNLGGMMRYASIQIDFDDVSADNPTVTPAVAQLSQNYPNPFNPSTTIAYNLQEAGKVSIEIFNTKGQKVTTLVNENTTAGDHTVEWNGKDNNGNSVASGVYLSKKRSDGRYTSTKKMILMK